MQFFIIKTNKVICFFFLFKNFSSFSIFPAQKALSKLFLLNWNFSKFHLKITCTFFWLHLLFFHEWQRNVFAICFVTETDTVKCYTRDPLFWLAVSVSISERTSASDRVCESAVCGVNVITVANVLKPQCKNSNWKSLRLQTRTVCTRTHTHSHIRSYSVWVVICCLQKSIQELAKTTTTTVGINSGCKNQPQTSQRKVTINGEKENITENIFEAQSTTTYTLSPTPNIGLPYCS